MVTNIGCHLRSLLLIEYVAATASGHSAENAIQRKDKRKLPLPVCPIAFSLLMFDTPDAIPLVLLLEISTYKGVYHSHLLVPVVLTFG